MGRVDATCGIPGLVLMEAAGRAVARAIRARIRPVPVLVLCGPGNNGGDGYVVARLLEQAGWNVAVAACGEPRPGGDAAAMAARWRGGRVGFEPARAARAGLVVDAVFGAGLARDVGDDVATVLAAARGRVVAVDVPSGLDGATGLVRGYARAADLTVTFVRRKPGHLLLPGRSLCGEMVCADIGVPDAVVEAVGARCFANAPGLWSLPGAAVADNKYSRGHVAIAVGPGMVGAARLAAMAARRVGAGLVTLVAPDAPTAALLRGAEPGVLVSEAAPLGDPRVGAWLVGPGLPPDAATRALGRAVIEAGRALVADAGLLSACAGTPIALAGAAVLTPHMGEFTRVFGPVGDRLAAARAAAALTGAVVLLKGADTVVAAPDGRAAINENAPPWLATGGTGDVLAGTIAGLLGRGMAPFEAACAAAWLQGDAAAAFGEGCLAEDLAAFLPASMSKARG
ncbi:NAD(P)H-hydrate dehydratase [Plastoroseomonas arctica]|uniref:Bifunctional NAD(P)H-hydrate repair enzyme n=2 Tax=Plastoroseomonas arctica TaxID=1509237 RepID=A0AAF1KL33_9PROT|nr:NAD(P)H-hydrate dehydratase [Plastoroseomonas arctica]MBR0657360.1 NAD(P)H-hydrate dehydratase [Plastoroseomonas arctica]